MSETKKAKYDFDELKVWVNNNIHFLENETAFWFGVAIGMIDGLLIENEELKKQVEVLCE